MHFLHSCFAKGGIESPSSLFRNAMRKGLDDLVFIQEDKRGVLEALKEAEMAGIAVRFAFPFRAVFEKEQEKCEGYFLCSTVQQTEVVTSVLEQMKEDYIPYVSREKHEELLDGKIDILIRAGNLHLSQLGRCPMVVKPIMYLTELQRALDTGNTARGASLENYGRKT
ncbi:hypothetical protein IMZ31_20565 (plasmid) [Pontibacillus sp. ALD_SL1]|uniref:hypothetical protein n=1 Tax=Pontibacillus sp. ALD_SL1 TaxID=2777185 RepID=UPI001A96326A|nr:hypothetical protein [Pontibacillus sp. ALD_SL1]QST02943.1 hypothetical protein IMZ31_20565 [Pontibacillus sp. ALD_SL1]